MKKSYGIILGSGLSLFSENLENRSILYENPDGIHHKRIFSGNISGSKVLVFDGRNHIYENPSDEELYFNILFASRNKIDTIILTNAAGGLNPNFKVADLMLINSYINFQFKFTHTNNFNYIAERERNREILKKCSEINLEIKSGTYCSSTGPVYETKSEIGYLRDVVKADAVGMSTVPEIMVASKLKIRVIAISCITNLLNTGKKLNINHHEVIEAGKIAYSKFSTLLNLIISENL